MQHPPSEQFCCTECFKDQQLIAFIREKGAIRGCEYCKSSKVTCIELSELRSLFKRAIDLFQPEEAPTMSGDDGDELESQGAPLGEWFQKLWGTFSDKLLDEEEGAGRLLDDLRTEGEGTGGQPEYFTHDGTSANAFWVLNYGSESDSIVAYIWHEFLRQIKKENRFFPEKGGDIVDLLKRLAVAMDSTIDPTREFYRCRRCKSNRSPEYFQLSEMMAPPSHLATAGRASPAGVPVLYLAEDENTAISETRPWKGAFVLLVKVAINAPIRVIDLTIPITLPSPFFSDAPGKDLEMKYLMSMLGSAFSRPVSDSDTAMDYLPTQYASSLFQAIEYDGVRFPSALSPGGKNLVLFDPSKANEPDNIRIFKIDGIEYRPKEMSPFMSYPES